MNKENPVVYIILTNYNNHKLTIECMESIFRNNYDNYKVIVVENASKNQAYEIKMLKMWAEGHMNFETNENNPLKHHSIPNVTKPIKYLEFEENYYNFDKELFKYKLIFIKARTNKGFAAGCNIGIRYALEKSENGYIWLLNNDTVIDKDALIHLVNIAESNQNIGACGSKLLYYDKPDTIQAIGGGTITPKYGITKHLGVNEKDIGQYDKEIDLDYLTGASFLVKLDAIKKTGIMDEKYYLYFEDTDWAIRIKNCGYSLKYEYKSIVYHKENATTGKQSPNQDYYIMRNTVIFLRKYYSFRYYFFGSIISFMGKVFNRIRRRQMKNLIKVIKAFINGIGYKI